MATRLRIPEKLFPGEQVIVLDNQFIYSRETKKKIHLSARVVNVWKAYMWVVQFEKALIRNPRNLPLLK